MNHQGAPGNTANTTGCHDILVKNQSRFLTNLSEPEDAVTEEAVNITYSAFLHFLLEFVFVSI